MDQQTRPQQSPEMRMKTLKVIWTVLMGSVAMYALVAVQQGSSEARPELELFRNMLVGFAVLVAIMGRVLPLIFYRKSKNKVNSVITSHIVRYAMFESVGMFAMLL